MNGFDRELGPSDLECLTDCDLEGVTDDVAAPHDAVGAAEIADLYSLSLQLKLRVSPRGSRVIDDDLAFSAANDDAVGLERARAALPFCGEDLENVVAFTHRCGLHSVAGV
jgi:hypothetical protein